MLIRLLFTCLCLTYLPVNASGMQLRDVVEFHPTSANIPVVTDPCFILHEEPESVFVDDTIYEAITIGVEEGELDEIFGDIADVEAAGDGTFLVLDRSSSEVRVYNFDGELLTTFGRPGEGPGEFRREPYDLSVADNGRSVFVLDRFGDFVTGFGRQDATTYSPKTVFYTDMIGHNGCAMNGHFWYYGYNPAVKRVLHKFTYEGELVASFLGFYDSPREYIAQRLSRQGIMGCSEKHGIVALNRVNAPVITGYREDGAPAWQVKLADFKPVRMAEYEGPGWGWYPSRSGDSMIQEIATDNDGNFLVYYAELKAGVESGHVFRIDAATGEGAYLGRAPNVRAVESGYVLSASNNPFPHVTIYKPRAASN